ncbi:diacylglycerol kinase family protein [Sphingobacterium pedocola]|uniref:Diacylglycerol kinase n=1 Tax=Sphingobacterium pedocola TaxID=2082722 RepID=A0ABR9T7D7_9SPHI|nr:diacylglycerol kinase family protein [Sphingobacterium pedocola]MBE8721277.1 diacylglycerol kinase [Sphingobacterium pedocola]
MKDQKFSLSKRIASFGPAFNGLKILLKEEHNATIHMTIALCTLIAGAVFRLSASEWTAIIFAIGLVFAAELINTTVEHIADFISPGQNDKIKKIKDMSAAAVLISATTALTIGLIIFIPKVF